MNKILHISAEIIDAPEPHKITRRQRARYAHTHTRSAIRHYQCTPRNFISCSPIRWSPTGVYEQILIFLDVPLIYTLQFNNVWVALASVIQMHGGGINASVKAVSPYESSIDCV